MEDHEFDAPVWVTGPQRDDGTARWFFVSLPFEVADEIEEVAAPFARGFGSVRVEVTVGGTTWQTSLFPHGGRRTYVLPVKKAVRLAEGLDDGSVARVALSLLDVPQG